jgi:hypothetical protein
LGSTCFFFPFSAPLSFLGRPTCPPPTSPAHVPPDKRPPPPRPTVAVHPNPPSLSYCMAIVPCPPSTSMWCRQWDSPLLPCFAPPVKGHCRPHGELFPALPPLELGRVEAVHQNPLKPLARAGDRTAATLIGFKAATATSARLR